MADFMSTFFSFCLCTGNRGVGIWVYYLGVGADKCKAAVDAHNRYTALQTNHSAHGLRCLVEWSISKEVHFRLCHLLGTRTHEPNGYDKV